MADYGIKASKSGQDVGTAVLAGLQFTSQYPMLKTSTRGSIAANSPGTVTIAHNLGYIPAFLVTAYGPTGLNSTDRYVLGYKSSGVEQIEVTANGTNLNVICSGTWTGAIYYYIFVDPGA